MFLEPAYMRKIVLVCTCRKMHAQADSYVRIPRVSLVYFSKNRFICSLKVIFFNFNISQVN